MRKYMMLVAFVAAALNSNAQFWNDTGNPGVIPGTNFLGSINPAPLDFRTNNIRRMQLLPTLTAQTIGTYTNENLSGNLGIGAFTGANVPRPFSLLHLDNGGNQFSGYRPWHRPGMTITNGSDLGWIGLKNEGGDINHFTLAWADNVGSDGPDLFKMIFLANPGTTGTAGTLDGLEAMRILPATTGLESFFGIGDWFTAGANPTQRLDVLDGKVRIRQLPSDPVSTSTEFVTVNTGTGILEHRPMASLPDNCEWSMNASAPNNVFTAVGTANGSCPDDNDNVGIGTWVPTAKLQVVRKWQPGDVAGISVQTYSDGNYSGPNAMASGIRSFCTNGSGQGPTPVHAAYMGVASNGSKENYGMFGTAVSSSAYPAYNGNYGGRGEASGPDKCHGLYGFAYGTGPVNYGVYGKGSGTGQKNYGVYGYGAGTGSENYGVVGSANGGATNVRGVFGQAPIGTNSYAVYSEGDQFSSTGSSWTTSDENLKTGIEDVGNGLDLIMQLEPKSYMFRTDEFPYLHLPGEHQYGLLAQDLEAVLPEMVRTIHRPADVDSTGAELNPSMDFKAVKYDGLVPLLISAVKQQQAMIAELQDRITACCSATGDHRALQNTQAQGNPATLESDLRIIPNPVADRTELRYTVGSEGTVRLSIAASDGRTLLVRDEGMRRAGAYSYIMDTTALAPGIYYCTLFVNKEMVVRRAVKVAR
ncbi:MAG: tail fiber domain-containing protein [Bacteroidetes bacterium]|nr:tail fiber domain-containing protein [Bacteroidota bacterium]MBS1940287.1 tail fiber domain-containing protein [Bacteroidota bacterium]